jgi:hypothetical protein
VKMALRWTISSSALPLVKPVRPIEYIQDSVVPTRDGRWFHLHQDLPTTMISGELAPLHKICEFETTEPRNDEMARRSVAENLFSSSRAE